MNINDLKRHSGVVNCASVMIRKTDGRQSWFARYQSEEDPAQVDECLDRFFDGNCNDMYEWDMDYLSDGCGVKG